MKKICKDFNTGCDMNCMECEIPEIEPEWCENCMEEMEESGIEYEPNFVYENDVWLCDNCRAPV